MRADVSPDYDPVTGQKRIDDEKHQTVDHMSFLGTVLQGFRVQFDDIEDHVFFSSDTHLHLIETPQASKKNGGRDISRRGDTVSLQPGIMRKKKYKKTWIDAHHAAGDAVCEYVRHLFKFCKNIYIIIVTKTLDEMYLDDPMGENALEKYQQPKMKLGDENPILQYAEAQKGKKSKKKDKKKRKKPSLHDKKKYKYRYEGYVYFDKSALEKALYSEDFMQGSLNKHLLTQKLARLLGDKEFSLPFLQMIPKTVDGLIAHFKDEERIECLFSVISEG
ncbi:hypothetical protein ADUPG1_009355 [Aduncisulcus paluster]|uniref:Uncharacterized protein n=1 Tax=Aduncisulcus paluster TaxID=2918883 RepID=A0ABQ5KV93_9EUKA|nr:hypothetical protein ADUPG1_009355 [Aduncisulcus paluster]